MRRGFLLLILAFFVGAGPLPAAADNPADSLPWLRATFFPRAAIPAPGQPWEIAAGDNPDHGAVRVLLRAAAGAVIELGDARHHYEITEPCLIILAHRRPDGATGFAPAACTPEQWQSLWGAVTYADLLSLEELVQDPARPVEETRRLVLQRISAPPFTTSVIQVRPRLSGEVRRLDCTLRLADFYRLLLPGLRPADAPASLWGSAYPAAAKP